MAWIQINYYKIYFRRAIMERILYPHSEHSNTIQKTHDIHCAGVKGKKQKVLLLRIRIFFTHSPPFLSIKKGQIFIGVHEYK